MNVVHEYQAFQPPMFTTTARCGVGLFWDIQTTKQRVDVTCKRCIKVAEKEDD